MGFVVDTTGQKVGEGNSKFTPIPAGNYEVTIYDAEIKPYKEGGANAGRPGVNYQFRISDGQPRANSRLFQTVGLFPNWAPTAKNPGGADNFTFFNFFSVIQGKKEKDFRAEVRAAVEAAAEAGNSAQTELPIPDPTALLGKALVVTVKVEDDEYAYKQYLAKVAKGEEDDGQTQADFKRNNIAGFKPSGSGTAAGGGGATKSAADDGLITL